MSRYIGKRVSYTCHECGKLFTWTKKSVHIENPNSDDDIFCSNECLEQAKTAETESVSIQQESV